jgi:predicted nucleotidyltransferase
MKRTIDKRDIYWPAPPRRSRESLLRLLSRRLRGRVKAAYIFGSIARGDADADSDLDLVIVADTHAPWPERGHAFLDLGELGVPVDVVVYTPGEWQRMRRAGHPFLATRREWIEIPLA